FLKLPTKFRLTITLIHNRSTCRPSRKRFQSPKKIKPFKDYTSTNKYTVNYLDKKHNNDELLKIITNLRKNVKCKQTLFYFSLPFYIFLYLFFTLYHFPVICCIS